MLTGGCPLAAGLVGRWTFDYLAQAYGDIARHSVHMAPRDVLRFSRFYGKGLGKGGVKSMSFAEFVAASRANEARSLPPWRYYVQANVIWSSTSKGGKYNTSSGGEFATPAGRLHHAKFGSSDLVDDVTRRVDWQWLDDALRTADSAGIHSMTLWAGMGGGCTPMHFDAMVSASAAPDTRPHLAVHARCMLCTTAASHVSGLACTVQLLHTTRRSQARARLPAVAELSHLSARVRPPQGLVLDGRCGRA